MLIFSFVIQNEMEELLIFMNSERGDSSLRSELQNLMKKGKDEGGLPFLELI